MVIYKHPVEWYLDKLNNNEPFSVAHYGDGEWQCIFNTIEKRFRANCEGTEYTPELSKAMRNSLDFKSDNFYFATPDVFLDKEYKFFSDNIDRITDIKFVDKQVWNKAMYKAELYPLISALRKKNVCIISNKMMRGLSFLNYDKFIEIDYPNCFHQVEDVAKQILEYGKEGVYIFACGVPASLFIQAVHGKIPNSWFIDFGSIWDGFVGIGGQRPTRREFYLHPETWLEWVNTNIGDLDGGWGRSMPKVHWHGMGSLDINPNL